MPLVCLIGLSAVFSFICLMLSILKSSDAYQGALIRIKTNPVVISALGEPVKEGFFFTGNISVNGGSGNANMSIPVSGPKGTATAYVLATKSLGQWHFDHLIIQTDHDHRRIDLSENKIEQR